MCSKDYLAEIQRKFADAFESQDPKLFDVVFDFDGKKLYADKKWLSLASTTFESMLSEPWNSESGTVKIETYKYDDFKNLLTFIYTGECKLTDQNIFTMLDIAEFYQTEHLKVLCDQYLSKRGVNLCNVFQLLETSNKYSLIQIKKPIHDFVSKNFSIFVKSEAFMNADKSVVKEFVAMNVIVQPENILQAVYEWAEHQATIKQQELSEEESFNMNDAIKVELAPILPFIEFKKMDSSFLNQYVVKRGFLFSYEELSDILECARANVKVTVTNFQGQSIYGKLSRNKTAEIELFKSLHNRQSDNRPEQMIYWKTECKIPSTPCTLKERDGVQWYLIFFPDGDIGVIKCSEVDRNDYLIAEMYSDTNFVITTKCKIEIE